MSLAPGFIHQGQVKRIGEKHLRIEGPEVEAWAFSSELIEGLCASPADHFQEGQEVEFVLIKPNLRFPGSWIASLKAVKEARIRQVLEALSPPTTVQARIQRIDVNGMHLSGEGYPVFVPREQFSWTDPEGAAATFTVGTNLDVIIRRIELPEGWLEAGRQRRARAVGSIRAILPMAFTAMPFKLAIRAKRALDCDPVMIFVLEQRALRRDWHEIAQVSGLPLGILEAIVGRLEENGYLMGGTPTNHGARFVEAIAIERAFNANPPKGRFASAAPAGLRFLDTTQDPMERPWPSGWPRPIANAREEEALLRSRRDDLPPALLNLVKASETRASLEEIREDDRFFLHPEKDTNLPPAPRTLSVTASWVFSGLAGLLRPLNLKLEEDMDRSGSCDKALLLRVLADSAEGRFDLLFYEIATQSIWTPRIPARFRPPKGLQNEEFPEPPPYFKRGVDLPDGTRLENLRWHSWCYFNTGAR